MILILLFISVIAVVEITLEPRIDYAPDGKTYLCYGKGDKRRCKEIKIK